jgi:hypothetical protein
MILWRSWRIPPVLGHVVSSRLASSAPHAAAAEKAMAPVLVLPGAIGPGAQLRQRVLFLNG